MGCDFGHAEVPDGSVLKSRTWQSRTLRFKTRVLGNISLARQGIRSGRPCSALAGLALLLIVFTGCSLTLLWTQRPIQHTFSRSTLETTIGPSSVVPPADLQDKLASPLGSLSASALRSSGIKTAAVAKAAMATTTLRPVKQVVQGQKMMEGAGVQVCRTLGTSALRNLDPYLMLDELRLPAKKAFAGFPDHPHRGFETCSIMLEGKMEHRDMLGNQGVIGPGGVQWMTAGRGIVHSEMPKVTDGELWGFQLWINLPAKDKMIKPRYQDYQADQIPAVERDGVRVRVMAGESLGATGPIEMRNPGMLMDVQVAKGATFTQAVPEGWNGFAYVCHGSGKISGTSLKAEQNAVLGPGDHIQATTDNDAGLRFLLVAGKPIGEPVVQYGPFVMNTQAEIAQAFQDYESGRLQNPDDNVWAAA
ncbi:hypothetical protein WJX72_008023 [[Myrmecia] bisecta]|uniref:Pirin n=1 Tax=[Myrmecia] bisecta TaxID=41462 RepID=A0AAW1R844_9CHLO